MLLRHKALYHGRGSQPGIDSVKAGYMKGDMMKKLLCVLMMSVLLSGAMGGAAEGAAGSNADLLLGDDV